MKFVLTFEIPDGQDADSFHRKVAASLLVHLRSGATYGGLALNIEGAEFFVTKIDETADPAQITAELSLPD